MSETPATNGVAAASVSRVSSQEERRKSRSRSPRLSDEQPGAEPLTAEIARQQFSFLNGPFIDSNINLEIPDPTGDCSLSLRSCPGRSQIVPLNGQRPRLVRTIWRPGSRPRTGEAASKQALDCLDSETSTPSHENHEALEDTIVGDTLSRVGSKARSCPGRISERPKIDSTVNNAGRGAEVRPIDSQNNNNTEGFRGSCELETEKEDFFGDSIEGEEALFRPNPTCDSFDSRAPTPDPSPERSMEELTTHPNSVVHSAAQEDLPARPVPLHSPLMHPLYRCQAPTQPATTRYPKVWQLYSPHSSYTSREKKSPTETQYAIPTPPLQSHNRRQSKSLPFASWQPLPDVPQEIYRARPTKSFFQSLLNGTASSHWAFYIVQTLIWSALTSYFFYRVSRTPTVLAFDCYELKVQLLHLFANASLPSGTAPSANATSSAALQIVVPQNASSVPIPDEFHDKLNEHCILRPVNSTVMLASSYGIWFVGMLAACGIAYLLEALALTQFRRSLVKSGEMGRGTLLVRLGVRGITAGIACSVVAGSAWAMKG